MEKQFMHTINDIDFTQAYEGYLWMSDECKPELFYPESKIDAQLFKTTNPFVVEGYLYQPATGLSYSIKYIDGQYLVYRHEVKPSDFDDKDVETIDYLTLRMANPKTLWAKFLCYWKACKDPLCADMEVLEMEKEVFVGFNKEER